MAAAASVTSSEVSTVCGGSFTRDDKNASKCEVQLSNEVSPQKKNVRVISRTAMGEYIPSSKKGGRPLTQLAIPLPGPADYSPGTKLTKPSPAQYSIVGKPKEAIAENFPGPNKYDTSHNMVWKDKGFPLIGKWKALDTESYKLGPNTYYVRHGDFGSCELKYSIASRPAVAYGPPNRLVQPVDTHGFKAPGPAKYRPSTAHWGNNICKSFGLSIAYKPKLGPGPAEYDIRGDQSKLHGPAYSLGRRHPPLARTIDDNPGPGAYTLKTTIGDAVAKSIISRQPIEKDLCVPSANTYNIPSGLGRGPKCSMTYRAFEKSVGPHPSPGEYTISASNLKKPAAFSCRKHCRPLYPDILHYPQYGLMKNSKVGPGSYNPSKNFTKNDAPSYSMGKVVQPKTEVSPGPASYTVKAGCPDAKRAPAFSIGVRIEENKETAGPGPAAYHPKTWQAARHSMSSRHKQSLPIETPAPNAYRVNSGQTIFGKFKGPHASLKGRPSPFVYSGLKNVAAC